MLGSEPVDSEIPLEREDLTEETQLVFYLYDKLPAKWEGFSGQYMGKDLTLLPILCEEFNIDKSTRKYAWDMIPIIDSFVAEDVARKIKSKGDLNSGGHLNSMQN
jgi:hypothetical protein